MVEALAIDIGIVAEGQAATEHDAVLVMADAGGPYDRAVTLAVAEAAARRGLALTRDVFRHYDSDVDAMWHAGHAGLGVGGHRPTVLGPCRSASNSPDDALPTRQPMTLREAFEGLQSYDLLLAVLALGLLAIAVLPRILHDKPATAPMLMVGIGMLAWTLPLGFDTPDPIGDHAVLTERITEFGVIMSLMVAGLAIDRRPGLRSWSPAWRLLAITMPLTILLAAVLGWWVAGLVPATAVLFGAISAPTDPVMGKDVEVGSPGEGAEDAETEEHDPTGPGEEDEVRFSLSAEAGLNDGLAFPFTNLAIAMALFGAEPGNWFGSWLVVHVLFKGVVALGVGMLVGRLFARTILRIPAATEPVRTMTGMAAVGATLFVYGVTEYAGGYGFIATFVCAATMRHSDWWNPYHEHLENFAEQIERVLLVVIMVVFGGAVARGLLAPLTWELTLVGLALVLVVRPAAGAVAQIGMARSPWRDRAAISFFGVRGIATFYYLAFALETADFAQQEAIWALAGFVVLVSIVLHGLTAAPVLKRLDAAREAREAA